MVAEYEFGLVMVSETESPKCCRKGAERPDDDDMHGGGGCRHPKPGRDNDCEDDDHHGNGDCGCNRKNHHDQHCNCEDDDWGHDCEDHDWDDDDNDNDCGCGRRHHRDCDDDDHNSHGSKKNKHKDPNDDCIVFPTPDRNRFHNQNNCGCRNN